MFTHLSKQGKGVDTGFSHWDEDEGRRIPLDLG